jgi:hypothetical protein
LFGPPPLLQPEDKAIYDAIVGGLAQDEKPRCFIARILIRDVADLVYQRLWLRRTGTRLIWAAQHQRIRVLADNIKSDAQHRQKILREKSSELQSRPEISDGGDSEAEKALEAEIEQIEAEIDQIGAEGAAKLNRLTKALKGPAEEGVLFTDWIGHYERLQSLLQVVDKNFTDALKRLDEYRDGLGQRVRQVADQIIDVQFKESPVAAPQPLVATSASSIDAAGAVAPSTQAVLRVAEPARSAVETEPSLQPGSSTERRRLHLRRVLRGRRSAPSRPQRRASSNPTSSAG